MGGFLILLIILGAVWLLFVVPARRRRRSHEDMQDEIELGDEIITAGGLHAIVRSIEDDVLEIELAPNTIVRLDRRAVAAVASEPEADAEPELAHPEQPIPPDDG